MARAIVALPARTVIVDGIAYETVWYPHRDALSLQPEGLARADSITVARAVCHFNLHAL